MWDLSESAGVSDGMCGWGGFGGAAACADGELGTGDTGGGRTGCRGHVLCAEIHPLLCRCFKNVLSRVGLALPSG